MELWDAGHGTPREQGVPVIPAWGKAFRSSLTNVVVERMNGEREFGCGNPGLWEGLDSLVGAPRAPADGPLWLRCQCGRQDCWVLPLTLPLLPAGEGAGAALVALQSLCMQGSSMGETGPAGESPGDPLNPQISTGTAPSSLGRKSLPVSLGRGSPSDSCVWKERRPV